MLLYRARCPTSTVSKPPVEDCDSDVPKSDMSDFGKKPKMLRTPLSTKSENKHLLEEVHEVSDPVQICNLVSEMSKKKKYKSIKINVEFYGSD